MKRDLLERACRCCLIGLWLLGACGDDQGHPPFNAPDAGAVADASQPAAAGSGAGCPLTPPTVCPDPKPTYTDVAPIFERHCLSCHDGKHDQWPLTTYQHVADWFGEVRGQLIACTMPPKAANSDMTVDERMQILEWIRCGYPE